MAPTASPNAAINRNTWRLMRYTLNSDTLCSALPAGKSAAMPTATTNPILMNG